MIAIEKTNEEKIKDEIIGLENMYNKIEKLNRKSLELFNRRLKSQSQLKIIINQIKELYISLYKLNPTLARNSMANIVGGGVKLNNYIIDLDLKFNENAHRYFKLLDLIDRPSQRIEILEKLKHIYMNMILNIDDKDLQTKNIVKNILTILNKNINSEKQKITYICNPLELDENDAKDQLRLENILDDIRNYRGVDHYILKDVMKGFRYIIRYCDIPNSIDLYATKIINRINDEKVYGEEYLSLLYSILDSIKHRKLRIPKEDKSNKFLNKCSKIIKEFLRLTQVNIDSDDNDYRFDIVCELLSSLEFYLVIKKLVNDYPDIVNVRKGNKHILEFILKEYIDNYKKLLERDLKEYKNIDYLREVYKLFSSSKSLCLTNSEKKNINSMIREFIVYVSNNVSSSKRKNHITKELKDLSTNHYYDEKKLDLREVNGYSYDVQLNSIKTSNSNHRERENEVDLSKEYTIMLSNDYICYSLTNNGKTKSLKVHTCDISNLIQRYKALDNYIYNSLLKEDEVNNDILSALRFNINERVSALTYEIILNNANQVIGFKVYRSKIRPNMRIYEEENNNKTYNRLKKLLKSIIVNQNYKYTNIDIMTVEKVISHLLNDTYLDSIRGKDIPYIYSGTKVISPIWNITIYSNIKELFNKLEREDFLKINDILDSTLEEFHYSDKPFDAFGDYNLYLLGKPNYLILQNQRVIKTLYMNELDLPIESYQKEKERFKIEYNNLIVDLNSTVGYISEEDFDYKKRRVKRKIMIPRKY